MKVDIIEKPGMLIVGARSVWRREPEIMETLWKSKVLPRRKEIKAAPGTENSAFTVFGSVPDSADGALELVAGMMVLTLEDIPEGMVSWPIPEGTYASTTAQGLNSVYTVYRELLDTWLPGSGYEAVVSPVFCISSNIANPTDPNAYWLVNVRVRKAGEKSVFDMLDLA